YYYIVTATTAYGETVASPETFATVGANATANLAWYPVPFATGYKVYRGTSPGGENNFFSSSATSFTDTGAAGTAGSPPSTSTATQSATVAAGAPATGLNSIQSILGGFNLIGGTANV